MAFARALVILALTKRIEHEALPRVVEILRVTRFPKLRTMPSTAESTRSCLLQWAKNCQSTCQDEGDSAAVSMIEAAVSRYCEDRFVLSIMGLAKRGKSTLINALLGRADDLLAPVDKLPATNVTTTFSWGETLAVEAILRDGTSVPLTPEDIRAYATEEGNPDNAKGVQLIRVSGPFPERLRGLTLVDLPGLGSIHEHHDQIIHQFLPQSDAVLLLTTARMPISQQEIDLLKEARKVDIQKLFVAINKVDETDAGELAECEAHNRKQLGTLDVSIPSIHRISARQAHQGEWESSGVAELWDDIGRLLQRERGLVMARRFVSSVIQAASPLLNSLAVRAESAGKSAEEIAAERSSLASEKKAIESHRPIREREFSLRWHNVIHKAESYLPHAEETIRQNMAQKIKSTGLAQMKALEKRLPTLFSECLEGTLTPIFSVMEEKLRALVVELDATYPCVIIGGRGSPVIKSGQDHAVVKTAVAGGALVAGGIGVASAASAAIAAAAAVAVVPMAGLGLVTSGLAAYGWGSLAPVAAALWPTTTVATAAAPSAFLLAAGPVGWAIAGLGVVAVPFAWSISRNKLKRGLQDQMEEHSTSLFARLKIERLPAIRSLGDKVLEEFRLNLERRLLTIDQALDKAALQSGDADAVKRDQERFKRFDELLAESRALILQ